MAKKSTSVPQSPPVPLAEASVEQRLLAALQTHWGYDQFRPLQKEAMLSVIQGEDSLVVLPTGGGKSLCYQAPAVCMDGVAVVISPLISLMKDQVDALRSNGVPSAFINSTLTAQEKRDIAADLDAKRLKLVYLAPEGLDSERLIKRLRDAGVSFFAIDEAHCVSHWGHDFRPHYRQLKFLREQFPNVGIHAFTATANERVRDDIIEQLSLKKPQVLVGSFDRPNLTYRVERRNKLPSQISAIMERHKDQAGIIYCISRKEVETVSAQLNEMGYKTRPYHAGLSDEDRQKHQEQFIRDEIQTIVATVAFGMGIDKPDVRYVIHAGIPKSIEHYQQETGRAGRDGLEAECWLFLSGKDLQTWKYIFKDQPEAVRKASERSLLSMLDYADGVVCRHRALVQHFGQDLPADCGDSCDLCRGEVTFVENPLPTAQKILSSIHRQGERFGGEYTARVLTGNSDDRVTRNGHEKLSTYGLLKDHTMSVVQDWIGDLLRQGFLERDGEYQTLTITPLGRKLLKSEGTVRLRIAVSDQPESSEYQRAGSGRTRRPEKTDSMEGVDAGLFEELKHVRLELAREREVPPYIIFGDSALREMARLRPTEEDGFRSVRGVGDKKCADFGEAFLEAIATYCEENEVASDIAPATPAPVRSPSLTREAASSSALKVFPLFEAGSSISEVVAQTGRALSTVQGYLGEFLRSRKITDPTPWVDTATAARVVTACEELGSSDRLTPLFEHLGGTVNYETLRIVVTCLRNQAADEA